MKANRAALRQPIFLALNRLMLGIPAPANPEAAEIAAQAPLLAAAQHYAAYCLMRKGMTMEEAVEDTVSIIQSYWTQETKDLLTSFADAQDPNRKDYRQ